MTTATPCAFPLSRQDLQLLGQIGFFAAHARQRGAATALFSALRAVRPDAVLPLIGLAQAEMSAGRPAEAARFLREVALSQLPGDPELTAFLGLALIEAGREAEARDILQSIVETESAGDDALPYVRMANKLLQRPLSAQAMPFGERALAGGTGA